MYMCLAQMEIKIGINFPSDNLQPFSTPVSFSTFVTSPNPPDSHFHVTRGWGKVGMGSWCSMGIKFLFGKMKDF